MKYCRNSIENDGDDIGIVLNAWKEIYQRMEKVKVESDKTITGKKWKVYTIQI